MIDVILVNPSSENCTRDLDEGGILHLLEIESYLQNQFYKTTLVNAQKETISPKKAAEKVSRYNPLAICVWVMYRSLEYSMSFFRELGPNYVRAERPVIVAAGYAASLSAIDLLKNTSFQELDAILLGEAEASLAEMLHALRRGDDWRQVPGLVFRDGDGSISRSQRRKMITNLDELPIPFRYESQFTPEQWVEIRGSRGCYHNCAFCSVGAFYGAADGPKWRGYSVSRMLQEIMHLYNRGARRFYFVDDQFFGPGKEGIARVRSFAQSLLDLGLDIEWQIFCRVDNVDHDLFQLMHQAGLTIVNIGIEGGSQTQLDRMNKRQTVEQIIQSVDTIRQLGLTLIPSFIMFDPYVTLDEIEHNINLIEQLDFITYLGPSCTIPFAGTSLTERVISDDLLDNQNPIIPNFLPNVRMVNQEVELLRTVWTHWQSWINTSFGNLETRLARASYAYQVSINQHYRKELERQYFLAKRIKYLEADYVRECIRYIRDGSSLEELLTMRLQYTDAISSIASAVSQGPFPTSKERKEVS